MRWQRDRFRDTSDRLADSAGSLKRSLRDTARTSAERLEEVGDHVQGQVRYAAHEANRYVRAHPLVVIGLAVAVSAILIDVLRTRR
ncbi:hypothetical protein BH24PSE2_BH24PSE2_08350 [soil metagenome]